MTSLDSTAESRVLLGMVGWNHPAWAADYYPADLPDDWRLAFLANQCECVLLRPHEWCGLDDRAASELVAALDEAPDALTFLLQVPGLAKPPADALARFAGKTCVLLTEQPVAPVDAGSAAVAGGGDAWSAPGGGAVRIWRVDEVDLRALRERAATLPPELCALLLDGSAATPMLVAEVRTLLQLLRIA